MSCLFYFFVASRHLNTIFIFIPKIPLEVLGPTRYDLCLYIIFYCTAFIYSSRSGGDFFSSPLPILLLNPVSALPLE